MHKARVQAFRFFGEDAGRDAVDLHRAFRLRFGFVDRGIRGRIYNEVGLDVAEHRPDRVGIGEVELLTRRADDFAERLQRAHQFPADLTGRAGDENFHSRRLRERRGIAQQLGGLVFG